MRIRSILLVALIAVSLVGTTLAQDAVSNEDMGSEESSDMVNDGYVMEFA